jgi:hypothetical protein
LLSAAADIAFNNAAIDRAANRAQLKAAFRPLASPRRDGESLDFDVHTRFNSNSFASPE